MAGEYSPSEIEAITTHMNKLTASLAFAQAERLVRFIRYVVEEALAGRGDQVNQYALAMELYNRDGSFDPATDSIVRVDAGRLRTKLREYYETDGKNDAVRFELPKGNYVVKINLEPIVSSDTLSVNVDVKPASPGKFSIVVLPVEALSQDAQDEELADGITTEIINDLGRAATFEVVSRRSAFAYKGRSIDAREIARELDVDYVLEGSLRCVGEHLRVAVALIDAGSGRQMWTESYDRESGDLLELQDDIGHAVAAALGGALRWAASERAQQLPADNLDPIGLVHRATGSLFKYTRRTSEEGECLVRRALEQAPDLSYGHTLLAFILAHEIYNCWTERPEEVRMLALTAVDRALELEPNDSWVLSFTSTALPWLGEPQRAVILMERALTLEPDNPLNRESMGHALVYVGRAEEGLAHIESAINFSPGDRLTPPLYLYRSYAYTQLGRYQEAEQASRKGVELLGGASFSWYAYANALAENGKFEEARIALTEIHRLSPRLTLEYLEQVFRKAFKPEELAENYLSGLRKLDWQELES